MWKIMKIFKAFVRILVEITIYFICAYFVSKLLLAFLSLEAFLILDMVVCVLYVILFLIFPIF